MGSHTTQRTHGANSHLELLFHWTTESMAGKLNLLERNHEEKLENPFGAADVFGHFCRERYQLYQSFGFLSSHFCLDMDLANSAPLCQVEH